MEISGTSAVNRDMPIRSHSPPSIATVDNENGERNALAVNLPHLHK